MSRPVLIYLDFAKCLFLNEKLLDLFNFFAKWIYYRWVFLGKSWTKSGWGPHRPRHFTLHFYFACAAVSSDLLDDGRWCPLWTPRAPSAFTQEVGGYRPRRWNKSAEWNALCGAVRYGYTANGSFRLCTGQMSCVLYNYCFVMYVLGEVISRGVGFFL